MKLKSTLYLLFLLVATQLFFACSSAKYYDFGSKGAYGNKELAKAETKQTTPETTTTLTETPALAVEEEIALATTETVTPVIASKPAYTKVTPESKVSAAPAKPISKSEVRKLIKEQKAINKANGGEKKGLLGLLKTMVSTVLLVILAIFIPPLAVYLVDGIGTSFWISLVLTLLFWIPGVIYALIVVLS